MNYPAAPQGLAGADRVLIPEIRTQPRPETERAAFRGPLRYEVKSSLQQVEAGRKFTVFVKITNPYDVPVVIEEVDTQVPVEFRDATLPSDGFFARVMAHAKNEALKTVEAELGDGERVSAHTVGSMQGETTQPQPLVLQPGNSVLKAFTLRTRREITFTPSTYTLQIQVKYQMSALVNHDTVEHQLSVRAPLKVLIYGGIVGALTGVLLKLIHQHGAIYLHWSPRDFATYVASVIVAGVTVVAFARKKDAQPFISVEDIWGGLFIGFVAGYTGRSFLQGILPT